MPSRRLAVLLLAGTLAAAPAARADNGGAGPPGATTPKPTGSGGAPPTAIPKPKPKKKAHRGAAGKGKRPAKAMHKKPKHHKAPKGTAPAPATGVFPVAGPHSYGGPDARFGAGRAGHIHQGQDVTAAEGTPLVSPTAGTVVWRANQPGGAGRYLVIRSVDGHDYVFMHLKTGTVLVDRGDTVRAGEQIAQVGHTGDATGPHLHFEVWVGGWQAAGGRPIDPLPILRQWDTTA